MTYDCHGVGLGAMLNVCPPTKHRKPQRWPGLALTDSKLMLQEGPLTSSIGEDEECSVEELRLKESFSETACLHTSSAKTCT